MLIRAVTKPTTNPNQTNLAIMSDETRIDYGLKDLDFNFWYPYNARNKPYHEDFYTTPHYELPSVLVPRLLIEREDKWVEKVRQDVLNCPWTPEAKQLMTETKDLIHTIKCIKESDMILIKAIIADWGLKLSDLPMKLEDHQLQSLALYITLGYANNWGQMRTGKTPPTIVYAYGEFMKQTIQTILVIVPASIKHIWRKEIGRFISPLAEAMTTVIEGTKANRLKGWHASDIFKVVNYESFRADWEEIQEIFTARKYGMILDESHRAKNPSKQTQCIQDLAYGENPPKLLIGLTGTPVANKPQDVVRVVQMTCPGLLGRSYEDFVDRYCYSSSYKSASAVTGYRRGALEKIQKHTARVSVRVLRKDVGMDYGMQIEPRELRMSAKQERIHEELRTIFRTELYDASGAWTQVMVTSFLAKLMKLQQTTAGFLFDKLRLPYWLPDKENPKLKWLDSFIDEYLDDIGKLVIACKFRPTIEKLSERYQKHGLTYIYGGVKLGEERVRRMEQFQSDPDCKIMVINTVSAEGLDLNPCQFVVVMTQDFQLKNNTQLRDRITGFRAVGKATIIPLLCRGAKDYLGNKSIDLNLMDMLAQKQKWADIVTGDSKRQISQEELSKGLSITKEDLFKLVG